MSSAEQIGRSLNSHLAAAGRRLLPDLYDLVQGRENPAVICRCQKTGIGGKSADHRTILKACDAAFNCELNLPDHRRMSPGWVPNRRMAAGFLQDSSPRSPHGDPAIDFALL